MKFARKTCLNLKALIVDNLLNYQQNRPNLRQIFTQFRQKNPR